MAEKQDIAMNAFTSATDAEYIYAEATNGSQVKIKKSDLLNAMFQKGSLVSKMQMIWFRREYTEVEI